MLGVNIGSTFAGDVDVKTMSPVVFDGNTLYVGGSGPNNYTTIQSAINDAVDGDTVFVYDDSSPYFENVLVEKSIALIGEDRNTVIIDGKDIGSAVKVTANNVHIGRFTIQNSSGDNNAGVFVGPNANYNEFIEITISDNNGFGYNIAESSNNLILNNTIINNDNNGIYVLNSNSNTISNNYISENNEYGIKIDYSNNNEIEYNEFHNNRRDDLYCSFANNTYIFKNIFIRSSSIFENCIDLSASSGCTIKRNTFEYKGGVFISAAKNIRVTENNFMSTESILFIAYIILFPGDIWFEGLPYKMNVKADRNYWYESRSLFGLLIPWVKFDWHPAQEPYDIGV